MATNKAKGFTAESIRKQSSDAVNLITSLIQQLKAVNQNAANSRAINAERMAELARENNDLSNIETQNAKLIENFESLLST